MFIFIIAAVALLGCTVALSISLEMQARHERWVASRLKVQLAMVDEAMRSDDRGKESY